MSDYVSPVGTSLPRLETREKIIGSACYTDDMKLPGMLHGAVLGSPYAHAKIVSIDTNAAASYPGVTAVITGDDFSASGLGPFIKDEVALARGKVRYIGEPVAAVAATDTETARAATRLMDVEYEELPAVVSVEEALAKDAPVLHEDFADYIKTFEAERTPNVVAIIQFAEGDVDAAWAECDVIVEGEFETQAQQHVYMEPCSALADIDAAGKITVWSGNQSVFHVQAFVAAALGMPMSKVRCITPMVGGGFGAKMEHTVQPIAAALARKAQKPVRVTLTREQDFEMIRARHPAKVWMKTGAKLDGTLVARDMRIVLDAGAYSDDSPGVTGICALFGRGPYHIDNVRLDSRAIYCLLYTSPSPRDLSTARMPSSA